MKDNAGGKCYFCENEGEVHDGVRVCKDCQAWFKTHIGVVCIGCWTAYWVIKTPENVQEASEMSGMTPLMIMDGNIVHAISVCKLCVEERGTIH
jgi:hypothetical protein